MEILYAAAEMVPFVKVGGLADVAGALTEELARMGHGVRAILPLYPAVRRHIGRIAPEKIGDFTVTMGKRTIEATLHEAVISEAGLRLLLIEQDDYFDRPNPYVNPDTGTDWPDNAERFAYLCHALPAACRALEWEPDVVHLNDYQLGPVAMMLSEGFVAGPMARAASVYSVHNLGYQGLFPLEGVKKKPVLTELAESLGFPATLARPTGPLEFYGKLNFMKAGLVYADLITTVSPTYAEEIQTQEHGFGLDGILAERAERLIGILNGIDERLWDPQTDQMIPYQFGPSDFRRKHQNKLRLLEVGHLAVDPKVPFFGMITRLVDQKGLDLFEEIADEFLGKRRVAMMVLGSGMLKYEKLMRDLAKKYPENFAARIGFDEPLAHLIEAGSDFFLMPSRYEPCGLNQMYSMRYGTVPIVRATGGLADSVTEFRPGAGTGRGFVFREYLSEALLKALDRAIAAFEHKPSFKALVTRIMREDFSWGQAARAYEGVYARARKEARKRLD